MSEEAVMKAANEHEEVESLLAWYVNGELGHAESVRVMGHLEDCEACRVAVTQLEQVQRAVVEETVDWTPDPGAFVRLRTQIAIEAPRPDTTHQTVSADSDARRGWLRRFEWLKQETALPRWSLGLQAAALAMLAIFAFGESESLAPPESLADAGYETLTSESAGASSVGNAERLLVGFARTATEPEIRGLLLSQGARIVAGPSEIGLYRLALSEGQSLDVGLARLRASGIVTLAEPMRTVRDTPKVQADPPEASGN